MSRPPWQLALFTMGVVWIVLVATAPGIPVVWDEGEYLMRAGRVTEWLRMATTPGDANGGLQAFTRTAIRDHWLFVTYAEGHPAGFAIPIAIGRFLLEGKLPVLLAARVGPMLVFGFACGIVAAALRRHWGAAAAIVAPIALLTFPRMFSEAHFATQDGQLTAWWLVLWAAELSIPSARAAFPSGVALGITAATKFSGCLSAVPVIASRIFTSNRRAIVQLASLLPVGVLIFYVLNPPLWHAPFSGFRSYLHLNLDRANSYDIPTLFFGRRYDMHASLPWYNTLAWLGMVTPIPALVLGVVGLGQCFSRRTQQHISLILHWATLMVVRALPGTPPHDGIRIFLPAFGFWSVLAGVGAQHLWDKARVRSARRRLLAAALAVSFAATAVNLARYYPQTLSHYNALVGGVRGAAALGMEPAYWWDALDNDALKWINEHTGSGEKVAFSQVSNTIQLREWRKLKAEDVEPKNERFKWYILQNRPGMFSDVDRTLMAQERPVYTKYAGRRSNASMVPWDLDVPLISVFSYEQYSRARAAAQ